MPKPDAFIIVFILATISLFIIVPASANPDSAEPFIIVRASLDDSGTWEVHQFVYGFGRDGARFCGIPSGATGYRCSFLDYALFRARHTLSFEGSLQEGLAEEFMRRDRIKRASHWGAYLFCPPFWPMHLLWELPFAGIDKERILDTEGYTLHLPIIEAGGISEIPLELKEPDPGFVSAWADFPGEIMEPVMPDDISSYDLSGAGFYATWRIASAEQTGETGAPGLREFIPGLHPGFDGIVILMLDVPEGDSPVLQVGADAPAYALSTWPGRFDKKFESIIYVKTDVRSYLGLRRVKPGGIGPMQVAVSADNHYGNLGKAASIDILKTSWPPAGTSFSKYPLLYMIIAGLLLVFMVFHLINLAWMKIDYGGKWALAIIDPFVAQLLLLVFGSIFAPFLGLGWVVGAYVAGRYIARRKAGIRYAWLIMIAYALILGSIYEAIFYRPLWV